ncbi:hypothetical protein CIT26_09895 [Mesorhizobium temperatum]|uniref:Non-haem dioxygenase N-terminal domain-containing protein n=2 Tax=Mesorhizobium temperatum TaxID=241416 RepID=A0A271LRU3_9HYPH|nr:hypothetical protein CIT26_09895 [Mesorhizobium temperatum]
MPVVDILDGTNIQTVAKEIRWALSNTGFMYVKNHGVLQDFVDSVFHVTRWFFDLRMSQKMMFHIRDPDVALRGYIGPFGENPESPTLDPFLISAEGLQKLPRGRHRCPRHAMTSACQLHDFLVA